jgi:hypothetical protein
MLHDVATLRTLNVASVRDIADNVAPWATLRFARSDPPILSRLDDLDRDPYLLAPRAASSTYGAARL